MFMRDSRSRTLEEPKRGYKSGAGEGSADRWISESKDAETRRPSGYFVPSPDWFFFPRTTSSHSFSNFKTMWQFCRCSWAMKLLAPTDPSKSLASLGDDTHVSPS